MMAAARTRWVAYALAGALTVAAMVWGGQEDSANTVLPVARKASNSPSTSSSIQTAAATANTLRAVQGRTGAAPLTDPFAVHNELGQDPARAGTGKPMATAPLAAPSAPALPFIYLGRWKEQGKTFVFLQRGDRAYKIDGPGALDADYAVQAVDEQRVSLKYLPLGVVQDLRLDAPANNSKPAAVVAPYSDPEPTEGN